jgi:dihydroneopterin triphosphate diphosphatase
MYKRPESVLVVVYTVERKVLLLKRRNHPDFWQSVTGSLEWDEAALSAAARELKEETGIEAGAGLHDLGLEYRFAIFPEWRHHYAAGVDENRERVYALCLADEPPVRLSDEHTAYGWFGFAEAAAKVRSWTNRDVIERIAREPVAPEPRPPAGGGAGSGAER